MPLSISSPVGTVGNSDATFIFSQISEVLLFQTVRSIHLLLEILRSDFVISYCVLHFLHLSYLPLSFFSTSTTENQSAMRVIFLSTLLILLIWCTLDSDSLRIHVMEKMFLYFNYQIEGILGDKWEDWLFAPGCENNRKPCGFNNVIFECEVGSFNYANPPMLVLVCQAHHHSE